MGAKIIKVYRESYPALRFIGRSYTQKDDFGDKWGEWFGTGLFDTIEALGVLPENGDAYLGAKRMVNGELEYWIGMLFSQDTKAPQGYDFVDINATDFAVCWVYGKEKTGELTSLKTHTRCLAEVAEQGFVREEDGWCFEKYLCPRYTTADKKGKVILDYCIAVHPE